MNGAGGIQDLVAAAAAVTALGWLAARAWRRRRGRAAGSCPDCPVARPIPGTRPAPQPRVHPTAEGEARLAALRRPPLIQIDGRRPDR